MFRCRSQSQLEKQRAIVGLLQQQKHEKEKEHNKGRKKKSNGGSEEEELQYDGGTGA